MWYNPKILEKVKTIVCGMCRGPDLAGKEFAEYMGLELEKFPAEWDRFGKSAGHRRNKQMAEVGTHLLLIWDGESSGSRGMKELMVQRKKKVFEVLVK